jgi:hypothetical protein
MGRSIVNRRTAAWLMRGLVVGVLLAGAIGAHATSGDASCFAVYAQSRGVPGTRGCPVSVAAGSPGGMGTYGCLNRLDLIDS